MMDIGWQNNHDEYSCFSPTMQRAQYFLISSFKTQLTVLYCKFYQGIFGYQAMKWLISMQDLVIFEVYATLSAQIDCE